VDYHQLIRANASGFSASKHCFYTGLADFRLRENMRRATCKFALFTALAAAMLCISSFAQSLKIPLPRRSKETPVQQLNREGVKQVQKHNIGKAKRLFYKAYLLDPDDPFTLNNLGYVSELEGDADRALRYYELSSKNSSQATIDRSSRPDLKGRPLQEAFASLQVPELKANKANVQAISLLNKGRVAEAESVLKKALSQDPRNPFTLNNMGYVMESEGDLQAASKYYSSAASLHSDEKVLVAPNPQWRGKGISEVASQNARAVNKTIAKGEDLPAQVARLNLRGVAALNHNDPKAARELFQQAYKLDPKNAFSLNNMGYAAEMDGDRETAESYYEEARAAADSNVPVTYASRRDAEGRKLGNVAQDNQTDVDSVIEAVRQQRQREGGPIQLKHRDNTPVIEPEKREPPLQGVIPPSLPPPQAPERHEGQQGPGGLLEPLPESQQPAAVQNPLPPSGQPQSQPGLMEPQPEAQQAPAARAPQVQPGTQPPAQAPQQQPQLMEPLPESQQPPAARTPQAQSGSRSAPQQQPQLLEPLTESQQPPAARTPQGSTNQSQPPQP
jgi:Flp pilus assembly protein TadD